MTPDVILAGELAALEDAALRVGDTACAMALRAAAYLANLGEEGAIARLAALYGAVTLLLRRGDDPSFGIMLEASRAITARIGLTAKRTLPALVLDDVLLALGRERAERHRIEGDYVRARLELAVAQQARGLLAAELDVARARLVELRGERAADGGA